MEKPKNDDGNTSQKIGVCVECKVRNGDYSKKELYYCPYCGRWFCKEHIEPRIATTRGAIEKISDPVLRDKVLEEWRRPDGHPDFIWTKNYFEELKKKQEEERKKFWEAIEDLKKLKKEEEKPKEVVETSTRPISSRKVISKRPVFRVKYSREKIDSLIWVGLLIYIISLFLPWVSFSFLGFEVGASWFAVFQDELEKIKNRGIVDFLTTSHYTSKGVVIFSILGLATILFGIIAGKNWIIFTGSLFAFISPLTLLYYLSQGTSVGYIHVSFTSFLGIGFWSFLLSCTLIAAISGKEITSTGILVSFLLVGVVSWLLLLRSDFQQYFILPTGLNQTAREEHSYYYEDVKSFIERTIKEHFSPSQRYFFDIAISNLKSGLIYFSGSFNNYTVCDQGFYRCDYGKEKGENINYLYCKPTLFSSKIFCFKKIIASDSGEIKHVIKKCVYGFVIDPRTMQVLSVNIGDLTEDAKIYC